ncbi:MAG: hypothetical protein AB1591_11060 [Pseudomonadota bacterium]
MDRNSLIFCGAALAAAFVVSAAGFELAAMPSEAVARSKTPVGPEELPEFDLGSFGHVSGIDLMAYWMEHPPAPEGEQAAPASVQRFGGC